MAIEVRRMDTLVVTVVLSNGMHCDHKYNIGNVSSSEEFEQMIDPILRLPYEALLGIREAKAFVLSNPMCMYNISHVMGLRIRGEGSDQARQLADHVHEMGFLARDRAK